MKHRMLKLLIPFWISVFFIVAMYVLTVPSGIDNESMIKARLSSEMVAIGNDQYTFSDYILTLLGLKSIGASNWFVFVTFYSYILFYVVIETVGLDKRVKFLFAYIAGLFLFAVVMFLIDWPAHYWRNLWALCLGMLFALYEKELSQMFRSKKNLFGGFLLLNVYFVLYTRICHDGGILGLVSYYDVALVAMVCFCKLMKIYELKKGFNLVLWMSGISYFVYLLHPALLNEQWLFIGHNSLMLITIISIAMAWVFTNISDYILRKI